MFAPNLHCTPYNPEHSKGPFGPRLQRRTRLRGLSMIELLVGMFLSLLLALGAWTIISNARMNATAQEAQVELAEAERFLRMTLSQLLTQTAYVDNSAAAAAYRPLVGWDNASAADDGSTPTSGTGLANSDALELRYIPSLLSTSDTTRADGVMVNCLGEQIEWLDAGVLAQGAGSRLFVADANGSPTLMCHATESKTLSGKATHFASFAASDREALLAGVETMQILYAVNTNPAGPNFIAEGTGTQNPYYRFMSASDVSAANAWSKVRAVRFGFVLRSSSTMAAPKPDAGTPASAGIHYFCPMGEDFCDGQYRFTPANASDGHLRRTFTTTVVLRNSLTGS